MWIRTEERQGEPVADTPPLSALIRPVAGRNRPVCVPDVVARSGQAPSILRFDAATVCRLGADDPAIDPVELMRARGSTGPSRRQRGPPSPASPRLVGTHPDVGVASDIVSSPPVRPCARKMVMPVRSSPCDSCSARPV